MFGVAPQSLCSMLRTKVERARCIPFFADLFCNCDPTRVASILVQRPITTSLPLAGYVQRRGGTRVDDGDLYVPTRPG